MFRLSCDADDWPEVPETLWTWLYGTAREKMILYGRLTGVQLTRPNPLYAILFGGSR